MVALGDDGPGAKVVTANGDEVGVFGEQRTPGVAVAVVPGPLQLLDDLAGDLRYILRHAAPPDRNRPVGRLRYYGGAGRSGARSQEDGDGRALAAQPHRRRGLALRAAPAEPPFPPVTDRAAWEVVREQLGGRGRGADRAGRGGGRRADPGLPATLFLEFDRTGERDGYQPPQSTRRANLAALVLAECLEDRGRFLDPILDLAWAICEEDGWVIPAHQRVLSLPIERQVDVRREWDTDPMRALPDVTRPVVDLGVAGTALEMAECDALVGARLDPMLGQRIRHEVDHRCLTPFLTRHDFHWLNSAQARGVNNWTAVCVCGIVGAATYLESDPAPLGELIARGTRSLSDYLDTFDPDGGSSEGPGYWSYGFGHYTVIAHLIEQRTGGRVSLLDGDFLRQIARYPARTVLSPGQYVNFSDCDRDVALISPHLAFLAGRLDLPTLNALVDSRPSPHRENHLTWSLRAMFWRPDAFTSPLGARASSPPRSGGQDVRAPGGLPGGRRRAPRRRRG